MRINCYISTESQKNGVWVRNNSASWHKVLSEDEYKELVSSETIRKLKMLGGKVTVTHYPDGHVKEIISDFDKKNAQGIKSIERSHYIFSFINDNNKGDNKHEKYC